MQIARRAVLASAMALGAFGAAAAETLRWSTVAFGPEALALWKKIAERAEGRIPGLTIGVEGTAFADYWTKLQTQLASGGGADLLQMQSLRFPGYAGRNVLRPLGQFIAADPDVKVDDFYPAIRQAFEHDGQMQVLPFDLGAFVTYINADLFAARGVPLPDPTVPIDWAKLTEIATALTNRKEATYGLVLSPSIDSCLPWIWSNGGELFGPDLHSCLVAKPESAAAIDFLMNLQHVRKVAAPVTDAANPNAATEAFVSGKVGMYFDGPWRFVSIRQNARFNWDVVPFPAGVAGSRTWVAGSGWGISTRSTKPELAWRALKELTSTDSLRILDQAGRVFPARQSTFALRPPPDAAPKNGGIVDRVLKGEIGSVRPLLCPPTWNEIVQSSDRNLAPLFLEKGNVADALDTLQSEVTPLLQRA